MLNWEAEVRKACLFSFFFLMRSPGSNSYKGCTYYLHYTGTTARL